MYFVMKALSDFHNAWHTCYRESKQSVSCDNSETVQDRMLDTINH